MGIKCFMVEPDGTDWRNPATGASKRWPWEFGAGAMWWQPHHDQGCPEWDKERALWVTLPTGQPFCIDGPSFDGKAYGPGWARTGEPPNISATPSVNYIDHWHGFITNGELVG